MDDDIYGSESPGRLKNPKDSDQHIDFNMNDSVDAAQKPQEGEQNNDYIPNSGLNDSPHEDLSGTRNQLGYNLDRTGPVDNLDEINNEIRDYPGYDDQQNEDINQEHRGESGQFADINDQHNGNENYLPEEDIDDVMRK